MFHLPPSHETPIYKPNFHENLSPREMWKPKQEQPQPEEKPKRKPRKKKPAVETLESVFAEDNREIFKSLTDDEKNLMCAGIVLSANWRRFLKPYLETFINPPRKQVKSEADKYELLNNNAIAQFCTELISNLEGRARRSPSHEHKNEETK